MSGEPNNDATLTLQALRVSKLSEEIIELCLRQSGDVQVTLAALACALGTAIGASAIAPGSDARGAARAMAKSVERWALRAQKEGRKQGL